MRSVGDNFTTFLIARVRGERGCEAGKGKGTMIYDVGGEKLEGLFLPGLADRPTGCGKVLRWYLE